jgi:hypothetical protein
MKNRLLTIILVIFLAFLSIPPAVNAAPSGEVSLGPDINVNDYITEYRTERSVKIDFKNSATTQAPGSPAEIASTVQYLRVSAAVINPARIMILSPATWEILDARGLTRSRGTVETTLLPSQEFVPPGPVVPPLSVNVYTWDVGSCQPHPYTGASGEEFESTLPVLLPQETLRLIIDVTCMEVGDVINWFFFKATEDNFQDQTYPTSISLITDKSNIYYSKLPGPDQTRYWLPLHNSYDPWDSDIASGHAFKQNSWDRIATNTAYAKTNKVVHQAPVDDPWYGEIHICGIKFNDLNSNGQYEPEIDGVINGVKVTLLGSINPDQKAEDTYPGKFTIKEAHGNPVLTGEGGDAAPGVYCFNLAEVKPGTYQFYIRIEEPKDARATTPTLITLAPITISDLGEVVYRINNNFGNVKPRPVGGVITPINKFEILTPYFALVGLLLCATAAVVRRART